MNKTSPVDNLASLLRYYDNIEPERLRLLVFFLQSLNGSFEYSFEIHHFRVMSRELEQDLNLARNACINTDASNLFDSQAIAKAILAASVDELELAAASVYFQHKGYERSEIEKVLNPDKDLLDRANTLLSELESLSNTNKAPALSGRT